MIQILTAARGAQHNVLAYPSVKQFCYVEIDKQILQVFDWIKE
jgi:hypothetical protein